MYNTHPIKNCATICFLMILTFSCKQDHSAKAIVTIRDYSDVIVRDAKVACLCVATGSNICVDGLNQIDQSNKNGRVEFSANVPCILKVIATYAPPGTTDSIGGKGYAEFKQGETTEQSIVLSPCNPCWSELIKN